MSNITVLSFKLVIQKQKVVRTVDTRKGPFINNKQLSKLYSTYRCSIRYAAPPRVLGGFASPYAILIPFPSLYFAPLGCHYQINTEDARSAYIHGQLLIYYISPEEKQTSILRHTERKAIDGLCQNKNGIHSGTHDIVHSATWHCEYTKSNESMYKGQVREHVHNEDACGWTCAMREYKLCGCTRAMEICTQCIQALGLLRGLRHLLSSSQLIGEKYLQTWLRIQKN